MTGADVSPSRTTMQDSGRHERAATSSALCGALPVLFYKLAREVNKPIATDESTN